MNIPLILAKVSFLKGAFNPYWVDGGPGQPGPILRVALADYAVAELVRGISQNVSNQEIGTRLLAVGKELATQASASMTVSFDDDDDICPPWYWNGPIPHYGSVLGPDPVPWLEQLNPAMNDVLAANALRQLASLTTSAKASGAIKELGESLMKGASSRLYDEYCGTPVKPRIPSPRTNTRAA